MKYVRVIRCTNPGCNSKEFTGWFEVSEKCVLDEYGDQQDTIDGETHDGPEDIRCWVCNDSAVHFVDVPLSEYVEQNGGEPPDYMIYDNGEDEIQSCPGELPVNSPFEVIV